MVPFCKYFDKSQCCCCSVTKSCPALCNPMDGSMPVSPSLISPVVCPSSCPLNQWCYPTSSSSVTLFSFCLQFFPASRSFSMSRLFASDGQSIKAKASGSVLPMNIQGWFPLGLSGLISLLFKGLSRVFSSTTIWKHQFFGAFFMVQLLHLPWTTGKPQFWLYRFYWQSDVSAF